jgi:hypothetical protein
MVFPESTKIAAELGNRLFATGQGVEARNYFDYAYGQKLATDLCKDDSLGDGIPYQWQFSHYIRQVFSP